MTATLVTVRRAGTRRRRIPVIAIVGLAVLAAACLAALLAPWLAPYPPDVPAGAGSQPPSLEHPLGTTTQGFDVLSQLLYGARTSLGVGLAVAGITTVMGLVIGVIAAYRGGWTDSVLSLLTNVFLVLPGLPLIVVLAAFLPPGPSTIILVLSITGWAFGARLFRSQALSLRTREFVAAAETAGMGRLRVMGTQIVPNMASIIAAFVVNQVVFAITAEASLEFLGLGDPTTISWGTMLFWAQTGSALLLGNWWEFVFPGLAIALTASMLTFVNYAVDETSSPRLQARELVHRFLGTGTRSSSLITPVRRTDASS
ncbi:ABC transporter permease [Microbacterium sp. NPDC058389]|uniref:ABC transporter permease n=1 Tax=Microbacterium sp. NPDC058389 TaxID=3346475 RepID=UPI00365ECE59